MFVESDTSDEYEFNPKEGIDYLYDYSCSSLLTQDLSAVEDIDIKTFYIQWLLQHHQDNIKFFNPLTDGSSGDFHHKSSRKIKSVDLEQALLSLGQRLNLKVIEELITIQAAGRANSRTLAENCFLILLDNLASDNILVVQNVYNPEYNPSSYSVDQRTIDKSSENCKLRGTFCKGQTYINFIQ